MTCRCIHEMDAELNKHNSRLQIQFEFGRNMIAKPYIGTEKVRPKLREKMGVVATFCPFCGTKYEDSK
jgi:hypothetical protein